MKNYVQTKKKRKKKSKNIFVKFCFSGAFDFKDNIIEIHI